MGITELKLKEASIGVRKREIKSHPMLIRISTYKLMMVILI